MRALVRILRIAAPSWPFLLGAAVCGVATVGANIGMMATAAYLISLAALQPPVFALTIAVTVVRFFTLLRASARYIERYLAHDAAFRLISQVRVWFYQQAEQRELAEPGGRGLWQRAIMDVETMQHFTLRVIMPLFVAALALTAVGWGLTALNLPGLAGILIAGLLVAGILLPLLLRRRALAAGRSMVTHRASLYGLLADGLQGVRDLAAAGRTPDYQAKVLSGEQGYGTATKKAASIYGLTEAGGQFVATVTAVGVLAAAIPLVRSGALDGVYLAALVLAAQASFEAVSPLAQIFRFGGESAAAAERLLGIGAALSVVNKSTGEAVPQGAGLTVQAVSVHKAARTILQDVSFTLPRGRKLAIVGPSGAGKSTLARVLLRLEEYEGEIRLAERELRDWPAQSVRKAIGLVSQQIHIFHASLAENLRLAKPDANAAELRQVLESVGLTPLVANLPEGLDTLLGNNGLSLSGGERQRLAVARALLADPEFLILDEPAASLDSLAERDILARVESVLAGRSFILITHRLAGLKAMDEILVMQAGRIVEQGNFAALMDRCGLFYDMYRLEQDVISFSPDENT